jgi:hypothetical protein
MAKKSIYDFVVPKGKIALSMVVDNKYPDTFLFDTKGTEFVPAKEIPPEPPGGSMVPYIPQAYHKLLEDIAQLYREHIGTGNSQAIDAIAKAALDTVINVPYVGYKLITRIEAMIKRDGKVHITWQYDAAGFAVAIDPMFSYLTEFLRKGPRNRMDIMDKTIDKIAIMVRIPFTSSSDLVLRLDGNNFVSDGGHRTVH